MVIGIASLIVVAFVVPLALTVRQQADERGRLVAERNAQTVAAVVVRATAASGADVGETDLAGAIGPIPDGVVVVLPDGPPVGDVEPDPVLVQRVETDRTALSAYTEDGFGLAIPIATDQGIVIVYATVTDDVLTSGVATAWLLLAALGLGLVLASWLVADRLGRTVVGPSERIAAAAGRLGTGDLEVRVEEEGPPELVSIAAAFNVLAGRIRDLLESEREEVADLSHRLRTPLTALRLQVEQLGPGEEREALLEKVDRLGLAVNELIEEARSRPGTESEAFDVLAVVRSRCEFWRVLADEQERQVKFDLDDGSAPVLGRAVDAGAAVDALIGNVFTHTQPGVAFEVQARRVGDRVVLEIADRGPGFAVDFDPTMRGQSGGESSGLGLDIVRRFAENAGGVIRLNNHKDGGAIVFVDLPINQS